MIGHQQCQHVILLGSQVTISTAKAVAESYSYKDVTFSREPVLGALQVQQMKLDQKGLSNLPLPGCPTSGSPAALVPYKGDCGPPQGVQIPSHGC